MKNEKHNTALVFNIVNGSFVDGYGIRTTVFLKGCPLKCIWCCNPEGQSYTPQLNYIEEHCNGCMEKYRCIAICQNQAIRKTEEGKVSIDRKLCISCGRCVKVCYFDALSMVGEPMTSQEVFQKVLREKAFFENSGGGLTIGGGEATCFPNFCLELIELCHKEGIHVAVDSCGYMVSERSFQVLLEADLILLDIKGMDEQEHIDNTVVSNVPIWNTLERLAAENKPVIIRVPLIPNYNYHIGQYPEMAKRLSAYKNIERVDILPFHEYGKSRYQTLGMEYRVQSEKVPIEDQIKIKEIFEAEGFLTQIGG